MQPVTQSLPTFHFCFRHCFQEKSRIAVRAKALRILLSSCIFDMVSRCNYRGVIAFVVSKSLSLNLRDRPVASGFVSWPLAIPRFLVHSTLNSCRMLIKPFFFVPRLTVLIWYESASVIEHSESMTADVHTQQSKAMRPTSEAH